MNVLTFETCWAVNCEIIKRVTSSWSIFTHTFIYSQVFLRSSSCKLCLRIPVTFWSYCFTWTPASSRYFELLMWKPGRGSGGYSLICDRVLAQLDSRPVHFGIIVDKLAVGQVLPSTSVSTCHFLLNSTSYTFIHISPTLTTRLYFAHHKLLVKDNGTYTHTYHLLKVNVEVWAG